MVLELIPGAAWLLGPPLMVGLIASYVSTGIEPLLALATVVLTFLLLLTLSGGIGWTFSGMPNVGCALILVRGFLSATTLFAGVALLLAPRPNVRIVAAFLVLYAACLLTAAVSALWLRVELARRRTIAAVPALTAAPP